MKPHPKDVCSSNLVIYPASINYGATTYPTCWAAMGDELLSWSNWQVWETRDPHSAAWVVWVRDASRCSHMGHHLWKKRWSTKTKTLKCNIHSCKAQEKLCQREGRRYCPKCCVDIKLSWVSKIWNTIENCGVNNELRKGTHNHQLAWKCGHHGQWRWVKSFSLWLSASLTNAYPTSLSCIWEK